MEQLIAGAQERGLLTSYLLMANTAFVMHNDPAYLDRARTAVNS